MTWNEPKMSRLKGDRCHGSRKNQPIRPAINSLVTCFIVCGFPHRLPAFFIPLEEAFSTSEKAAISLFLSETADVKIEFRNRVNKQRAFMAKLFYSSISVLSSCQKNCSKCGRNIQQNERWYAWRLKDMLELFKMLIQILYIVLYSLS